MYDLKKLSLPKFGLILGHNNETQLCLVLKMNNELKNNGFKRYFQILVINELYLGMEITKKERM
jgi:hypothetical protein